MATLKDKNIQIRVVLVLFGLGLAFLLHKDIGAFVWETTRHDSIALFISGQDQELKYAVAHYYFNGGAYDLVKAEKYFRELLSEEQNYLLLYQLGRIHFVNGNLAAALTAFNRQLELYPEEKRAYYMRGLTHVYREEFVEAVDDFEAFVQWEPNEWAGYNDLSWAYFKTGDFEKAAQVAQEALMQFPDNLWLHNMAGVALWNLDDLNQAELHLVQAQEQVGRISVGEWGGAYPGNNPETYETSLENMRHTVATNLEGIRNEMSN